MKIGVFGYYNSLNYGDDRLAMSMLHLLGEHDAIFLKHHKHYSRSFLKDFDLLVFGGGGLVFKRVGVWVQILRDIRTLRIPTMVIGLGANSYDPSLQPEIDYLVKNALIFAVRDERSKRNLGGHPRIEVYPDITWLIPMTPPNSWYFNHRYEISINASPVPWASFDHDKLFDALVGRQCVLWPLNFRNGIDLRLFDGRIAFDRINSEFSSVPVAVSELTIAMRFHAIIFAIQMLQPFIAIAYDHKVLDLCCENGLDDLCLRLEDVQSAESKIKYLRDNRAAIIERISSVRIQNVVNIKPLALKVTKHLERLHSKPTLRNRIASAFCG